MGKWTLAEVEALAHKIVKTYFCDSDVEFLISTFAEDIIWLGGGEKQKAEGREAVAACFRMGRDEMIAFDMSQEQYHSMELGGGSYVCEGVSWLDSKPESETYLSMQQRVTFVFRERGDRLETAHIHNSVPFSAIRDDELFPVEAGRAEFQRLKSALVEKNQEYQHQAQFLETLYNTIPCGIIQFTTDPGHETIAVNPMTWKFYGYSSEEEYRQNIKSPLHAIEPEDYDWIEATIDKLVSSGDPISYHRRCRKRNGDEAWVNVVMDRIVNGNGQEVIQAVFTDITEQMRLEKAQEQERILENRSLRTAIYTAYPLIISVNLTKDTYNCIIDQQTILSIPGEGRYTDLLESTVPDVYHSYQADFAAVFSREEILRRFESGEREIYMELQEKGLDGEYHWIAACIIYVENPFNADVLAIDLVKFLDAQRIEQARQEQLLRDALASANAANRAKSDFLSRMSHDIRTPMNAIIGMSAIGKLKIHDPEVVRDCFQKIDASSQYLLSLINDILDMAKIETNKMEIAHAAFHFGDFLDEVKEIIYPQTEERNISCEIRRQESMESYYIGDPLRMKQILMNLLSNALKFTSPGGRITMDIKESHRTNGFAYLQFVVSDNGIGMSQEFIQRIFQPFEQEAPGNARNNVGSGLGLSIVYNLVQLMGGAIHVKSQKHGGSVFTVTIPFQIVAGDEGKKKERKGQKLSGPLRHPALEGLRILIVEDNALNQEIARTLLEMNGVHVDVAGNGREAVERFRGQKAGTYQAILMDIRMPVMDGLEASRQIRAMDKEDAGSVPILAMTANAFEQDKKEACGAGMSGYLVKPLDIDILMSELEKCLERQ